MYLLGGEVERGELADLLRVIGRTIGKLARTQRGARVGQVFVAEERQPCGIGRRDPVAYRSPRRIAQALAFILGDAAGHVG